MYRILLTTHFVSFLFKIPKTGTGQKAFQPDPAGKFPESRNRKNGENRPDFENLDLKIETENAKK